MRSTTGVAETGNRSSLEPSKPSPPAKGKTVAFRVYRGGGEGKGKYETFNVPYTPGMVVLTAIQHIQGNLATDLGARWNCRAGKCGSCGAEINGMPRLMCKTRVDELSKPVVVRPYKTFPHIKDLITDVQSNYDWAKRIPSFRPPKGAKAPWTMYQKDMDRAIEFRKCIECFLCQDVCHVLREHNSDYAGPRYMVRIANLETHPMDTLRRTRFLKDVARIGYCNITKCCEEVCPEEIHITDNAIIPMKERVVSDFYDPLLWILRKITGKRQKLV